MNVYDTYRKLFEVQVEKLKETYKEKQINLTIGVLGEIFISVLLWVGNVPHERNIQGKGGDRDIVFYKIGFGKWVVNIKTREKGNLFIEKGKPHLCDCYCLVYHTEGRFEDFGCIPKEEFTNPDYEEKGIVFNDEIPIWEKGKLVMKEGKAVKPDVVKKYRCEKKTCPFNEIRGEGFEVI